LALDAHVDALLFEKLDEMALVEQRGLGPQVLAVAQPLLEAKGAEVGTRRRARALTDIALMVGPVAHVKTGIRPTTR